MPSFYAHLLYGREVCRKVQPSLQRALLSYGVESEKKLSRQKQAATVAAE